MAMERPQTANDVVDSLKLLQIFDYQAIAGEPDFCKLLADQHKRDGLPSTARFAGLLVIRLTSKASLSFFSGGPPEELKFSDTVIKINKVDRQQKRLLVITNKAIYNFLPRTYRKFQRRILLADLRGMIMSRSSDELVFQISNNYDYRFGVHPRCVERALVCVCYRV